MNLLCNPAIPSSAVSCVNFTMILYKIFCCHQRHSDSHTHLVFKFQLTSLVVVEIAVMFRFMNYRQAEEMEQAVQNVGKTYTDDQINMLAQRHFENSQVRNLDR